jgi:hypothetical protein
MKLRLIHIVDEDMHKILILDKAKTREEGRLLAWTCGATKTEARALARDAIERVFYHRLRHLWK